MPVGRAGAAGLGAARRDTIAAAVGENIRSRREARGLSQARFAAVIGCGRTAVCRWETGSRLPPLPTLLVLAKGLGCEPAALLEGAGDEESEVQGER